MNTGSPVAAEFTAWIDRLKATRDDVTQSRLMRLAAGVAIKELCDLIALARLVLITLPKRAARGKL